MVDPLFGDPPGLGSTLSDTLQDRQHASSDTLRIGGPSSDSLWDWWIPSRIPSGGGGYPAAGSVPRAVVLCFCQSSYPNLYLHIRMFFMAKGSPPPPRTLSGLVDPLLGDPSGLTNTFPDILQDWQYASSDTLRIGGLSSNALGGLAEPISDPLQVWRIPHVRPPRSEWLL